MNGLYFPNLIQIYKRYFVQCFYYLQYDKLRFKIATIHFIKMEYRYALIQTYCQHIYGHDIDAYSCTANIKLANCTFAYCASSNGLRQMG